jgi:hypothetical protein
MNTKYTIVFLCVFISTNPIDVRASGSMLEKLDAFNVNICGARFDLPKYSAADNADYSAHVVFFDFTVYNSNNGFGIGCALTEMDFNRVFFGDPSLGEESMQKVPLGSVSILNPSLHWLKPINKILLFDAYAKGGVLSFSDHLEDNRSAEFKYSPFIDFVVMADFPVLFSTICFTSAYIGYMVANDHHCVRMLNQSAPGLHFGFMMSIIFAPLF